MEILSNFENKPLHTDLLIHIKYQHVYTWGSNGFWGNLKKKSKTVAAILSFIMLDFLGFFYKNILSYSVRDSLSLWAQFFHF